MGFIVAVAVGVPLLSWAIVRFESPIMRGLGRLYGFFGKD